MSSSPIGYDPADPFGALERAGVAIDRDGGTFRPSFELNGVNVPLGSTAGERFTFGLPEAAQINVAFGKEGVLKKISKIFKTEPQVGDPAFDDEVYITANSERCTRRLLDNDDLKALILGIVTEGGLVAIGGAKIEVHAVGRQASEAATEKEVARLVCHVMAFEK